LDLLGLIALCLLVIVLCVVPLMPYVAEFGIIILTVVCYLAALIGAGAFIFGVFFVRSCLRHRNDDYGNSFP
jgi:hypothetical protein